MNYLSQSACFQGCHNLQRMDLEECVLVSIIVQCHLGFREPFQEFKEENEIMFHSCGTKSSFCVNKIVWLFFLPFLDHRFNFESPITLVFWIRETCKYH